VTNLAIALVLVVAALAKGRPASFKPRPHAVVTPGCVFNRMAELVVETGGLSAVVSALNLILVRTFLFKLFLNHGLLNVFVLFSTTPRPGRHTSTSCPALRVQPD
jgi:hypothetical protein